MKYIYAAEEREQQARRYCSMVIYGFGWVAIVWGLMWAAGAYAAEINLRWIAPTENVDGSPLTDLAGYRVYYGENTRDYRAPIPVDDPNATTWTFTAPIDWLQEGDNLVYFAITAIDDDGNESGYSNEIAKTITVADTTPPAEPVLEVQITITITECPAGFTCNVGVNQ